MLHDNLDKLQEFIYTAKQNVEIPEILKYQPPEFIAFKEDFSNDNLYNTRFVPA